MQFKLLSALALLGAVSASPSVEKRQAGFCPEAARFGNIVVSPNAAVAGDVLSVTSNFTCSFTKGIRPQFLDYYLEVPSANNNGHEPPVLLARREFDSSAGPIDQFTATLSSGFFFNATYEVVAFITYPITGSDGSQALILAQTSSNTGVNVTVA